MIKTSLITINLISALHLNPATDISEKAKEFYNQTSNCNLKVLKTSPALDISLSVERELKKSQIENNKLCKNSSDKK
ncbi:MULTISPECIES: hypothetical protein [Mammaliicoccus]|uniref:Uncharacterized protein n=1 Tax=Mammaliicoccus fleurettii TaxID=150056 RepID=A0ABS5MQD9_9STAP|nr:MULTISPECIES: hypothetical protein [Mammaliicoccus]MBL0847746.1 hypothetical protein [Mammaliicoccus fleurettii]MBS3672524.1 hypothetical protein [Mammaliicoccus fleurettii]MBS3697432.1 hypothetical protein [Mammaliicoccus fleurettii]MBW0765497.1 hypothetical protein [Mammaliicoccus fleurettii]MEB7805738.1 hypothetical protein [Mammaliicoccus fleurettii]